jgi:hypothetical protein
VRQTLFHSSPWRQILIFTIPVFVLYFLLFSSFVNEGRQQFSELAQSFTHGKLYFQHPIGGLGEDPVLYHGKVYWDDGPFPAILLIPFVALFSVFHQFYYQGYLTWVLIIGVCYFVYKLARHVGFGREDATLLMLGFVVGSVFIGVGIVSSSWLFAQVLTTFLLFWALYEYFLHCRWWLIGCIVAAILMTRITAAPILVFFILELWRTKLKGSIKFKKTLQLGIPIAVAVILLGLYNYLRFHNPFNGGFKYQELYPNSAESRSLGMFSLLHIPSNFYSAFLRAPVPVLRTSTSWTLKFPYIQDNTYGMSMFITSPYLLYLFTVKWSLYTRQLKNLLVAIFVSGLMVLTYFGLGLNQYGYRYALDFLPGAYLLLMMLYKRDHPKGLTTGMRFLLLGSTVINFFLVMSFAK